MRTTRRMVLAGLGATLAGCGRGPVAGGFSPPARDPILEAVPNPAFAAYVTDFRGRAGARGVSDATLAAAFRDVGFLPGVIERDRNQTEFKRTLEDYLAIAASDKRITNGRTGLRQHARALEAIEAQYGVDRHVVTAVWGLESSYGTRMGNIPVMSAMSTLAFEGRRRAFFESQMYDALTIVANRDIPPDRMTGSWAGAMGHTQFMPSAFTAYAVDFTGDGRRDIWSADPTDALASTANYLARSGWRRGAPWGMEVRLPAGFDAGGTGRKRDRAVAAWRAAGVTDMDGRAIPDHGPASILLPEGAAGPAFLAYRNFEVISRYNNAVSYVIGIGHLSDRLKGGDPIRGTFPPDRFGLTIEDRKRLQSLLTRRGFDTGGVDGVLGSKTEAAIRAYQESVGLPATGNPSPALLAQLG